MMTQGCRTRDTHKIMGDKSKTKQTKVSSDYVSEDIKKLKTWICKIMREVKTAN